MATQSLWEQSNGWADLVAGAASSVVRVEGRCGGGATGVAWTADGLVVTAAHAVEQDAPEVVLPSGERRTATVVGADPGMDLAVLRAAGAPLPAANKGPLDGVRVGHLAVLVGRPGKSLRARLGMVSALGPEWRTPGGRRVEAYLETDAGPARGFSGAPLVAADGRVLGIQTGGLLRGTGVVIPVVAVDRVVAMLTAHGKVRTAFLGIAMQPVPLKRVPEPLKGHDLGLLVTGVEPDSPAERAGILVGDIVVSIGSDGVQSLEELRALLSDDMIDRPVDVRLLRGGEVRVVPVTLAAHP
ncbi:MAG: trypsin-like peptidase domain-containing protein [Deltaproteobacteria bacterium]|nr:trypsin-like peptidase domain-containing protein [Deltaproteobacteria bacterium]